jgi:HAD superfamily hydrolase (TIGR01509 family)
MPNEIEFVFFDIGGTLGERNATTNVFTPFPSSVGLLESLRNQLGLKIGIITTLGSLTNAQGLALLQTAALAKFLNPNAFVSEHDAGVAKPDVKIYNFAAERVGVPISHCLFVGENLLEVIGAMTAGMKAVLKPCPPGRELPI